jgi:hypothetical protein
MDVTKKAALTGLLIAVAVFVVGFWANGHSAHMSYASDLLVQVTALLLCPPCWALSAGDNARGVALFLLMVMVAFANAAWYIVLGALGGKPRHPGRRG